MKAGARAQLLERDITRLGTLGEFDVVLCVNDVVNYVLDRDGVRRVLSGAAANLAPGGALVFDANTLRTFRVTFATSRPGSPRPHVPLAGTGDAGLRGG